MSWLKKQVNKSENFDQAIAVGIAIGIVLGIAINLYQTSSVVMVERVYAEEAEVVVPVEVMVEVVYSTEDIERKIRETFIETPNTAVAVGKSESGESLKADAYNPEWHYDRHGNKICQGSYGVMQIACVHHLENPEALFDVEFNLAKAREIYNNEGWQPWGGYTSGGHKKYLE